MKKSALNKEHLAKLADYHIVPDNAVCMTYQSGETLLLEGQSVDYLLIVVAGTAKVCVSASNGRDLVLCYYISEGIVGDMELMTGTYEASTTIIAMSGFECIALPYRIYASELKANISFLNIIGRGLSLKLLKSSKNYLATALHSGEERLCAYILQAQHNGVFSETLTDVARLMGISYRHLFRILNQLCADGVLRKAPNGYHIVDQETLIRMTPFSCMD